MPIKQRRLNPRPRKAATSKPLSAIDFFIVSVRISGKRAHGKFVNIQTTGQVFRPAPA